MQARVFLNASTNELEFKPVTLTKDEGTTSNELVISLISVKLVQLIVILESHLIEGSWPKAKELVQKFEKEYVNSSLDDAMIVYDILNKSITIKINLTKCTNPKY